jgi:hypothetical protein
MNGQSPVVTLGCLHAHHANISYIDQMLDSTPIRPVHFVDPGLMRRITTDQAFRGQTARAKVDQQLGWMASCGVDAILLTCTNYIAELGDESVDVSVPIIKIDEPFFGHLCRQQGSQLLLFTNPATVEGTMGRLRDFADRHGPSPSVEVKIIEGTFDLFMAGRKDDYDRLVAERVRAFVASGDYASVSVGQLSMADAAMSVSRTLGLPVGNPLDPLRDALLEQLQIAQ